MCDMCWFGTDRFERDCHFDESSAKDWEEIYGNNGQLKSVKKCDVLKSNAGSDDYTCPENERKYFCEHFEAFIERLRSHCYDTPGCGMFQIHYTKERPFGEAHLCRASSPVYPWHDPSKFSEIGHPTTYVLGNQT